MIRDQRALHVVGKLFVRHIVHDNQTRVTGRLNPNHSDGNQSTIGVLAISDRVMELIDCSLAIGKLVECADTDQIFTRPGEQRTEEYVTGRFG